MSIGVFPSYRLSGLVPEFVQKSISGGVEFERERRTIRSVASTFDHSDPFPGSFISRPSTMDTTKALTATPAEPSPPNSQPSSDSQVLLATQPPPYSRYAKLDAPATLRAITLPSANLRPRRELLCVTHDGNCDWGLWLVPNDHRR